ncbi:SGNH/GDSL hydrolase family protein [Chitinophaga barathri]|uniref:Hydrolase n=1 Tax=Chitinophaga barathri TaxID=1647451 RepID=A0A3N4MA47_9BACT|nr:SGNH/GDSL hydrolase family protein [Chitinophaga barathri]RPD40634.1 hydrolase [Chitinophaga barathri]
MRLFFLLLLCTTCAFAQEGPVYTDARNFQFIGKGLPTNPVYVRLDTVQTKPMTDAVKYLSTHSAGIAVLFRTNSPYIHARWKLIRGMFYTNISPIAHSGLDLYCLNKGRWQWCGVGRPGDKDTLNNGPLVANMDTTMKEFLLYLPTYNQVTSLEIGVAPGATLSRIEKPAVDTTRRVVIYGSSILQGASAGRPGMAYPSILQRRTGWEFINLGFSGNGKMEFPVAELLATMPAKVFVLDCIPNPSAEEIRTRAYPFIKHLLDKRPEVPILLVEAAIREHGYFDQKVAQVSKDKNDAIREAYTKLKKEGYKQLYYLPATDLTGHDHEGTIDGVHLTDLGFMRQAEVMLPLLEQLMKKSVRVK